MEKLAKIAIVGTGYPGLSGGSAITLLALSQVLQNLHFDIEYINIKPLPKKKITREDSIFFANKKINISYIANKQHFKYFFFREKSLTKKLQEKIKKENIKFVFFYGVEVCALVDIKKLSSCNYIILGDPMSAVQASSIKVKFINLFFNFSINLLFKFCIALFKQGLLFIYYYFFVERRVSLFLGGFATANHHAEYYKKHNKNIIYLPAPVMPPSKKFDLKKTINSRKKKNEHVFLIIGHNLAGTSNSFGFIKFVEKIKILEKFVKDLNWKIYIVGSNSYNYNSILINNFLKNRIKIIGHKNLEEIQNKIYALLNFIDDPLGNRTRISQCFAYGIPTLSHVAALFGTPELKKNSGAIFYKDEKSFVKGFRLIIENSILYKKLSYLSYKTYKNYHSQKRLEYYLRSKIKNIG